MRYSLKLTCDMWSLDELSHLHSAYFKDGDPKYLVLFLEYENKILVNVNIDPIDLTHLLISTESALVSLPEEIVTNHMKTYEEFIR